MNLLHCYFLSENNVLLSAVNVGIDIIETSRVAEKIRGSKGFRERVFSETEIQYCEAKKNKAQHYAARFAAKEALLKALGTGLREKVSWVEMEVRNDESGKPFFLLTGETRNTLHASGVKNIHVSLSHLEHIACAVVIIER